MAKFYGTIGFVKTVDNGHGVHLPVEEEIAYVGDLTRNNKRWSKPDSVNGEISMSNEISIVADDYMLDNQAYIEYVTINGSSAKWKVNTIMIEYPRIRLEIGGVYNE